MKKRTLLAIGAVTVLLLTGCQSSSSNAETEALKEQVAQLEQQIADLQTADSSDDTAAADTGTADTAAADTGSSSTTYTLEELTTMVNDYVTKANAATPSGSNDMEQFFSLKQEANQIDNELEIHENELERQYRDGTLTRDEFRTNERELDHLEDLLDAAEDQLEYVFGIDD